MAGHVALIGEAHLEGDIHHPTSGDLKEKPGAFHPAPQHVLVRRRTGGFLEHPREMIRAQPGTLGERIEIEVLGEMLLDVLKDRPEPLLGQAAVRRLQVDRFLGILVNQVHRERRGQSLTVHPARPSGFNLFSQGQCDSGQKIVPGGNGAAELNRSSLGKRMSRGGNKRGCQRDGDVLAG